MNLNHFDQPRLEHLSPSHIHSLFFQAYRTRSLHANALILYLQLGFPTIPETKPEGDALDEQTLKDLHTLLLETRVVEGKLVCGSCGHEYKIKEGIANFLLPSHLGGLFPYPDGTSCPIDFCGVYAVPLTSMTV